MQDTTCYSQLRWPTGYARTPRTARRWSQFGNASYDRPSLSAALNRLEKQLSAFTKMGKTYRTKDQMITANVPTGAYGRFKSGMTEPDDTGVAVYFELDGKPIVLCCDAWTRVACNVVAIAKTLEAMRGLERWQVTETGRAFDGFAALPEKSASGQTCWDVLGIPQTKDVNAINAAWKEKAKTAHPDKGGSDDAMAAVNEARDQAVRDALSQGGAA